MTLRTFALLCATLSMGCNSSEPNGTKDVGTTDRSTAGDAPSPADGRADQPQVLPDRSLADLLRTEGGVALDTGKPTDQSHADKSSPSDKGPGADAIATCGKLRCDCTAFSTKQNKWLPLFGKANQATLNADFKVRIVNLNGALKVKQATILPNKCGEWQAVSALPTFTYQIVTFGEDFTIQYDQIFPGINTGPCPSCK